MSRKMPSLQRLDLNHRVDYSNQRPTVESNDFEKESVMKKEVLLRKQNIPNSTVFLSASSNNNGKAKFNGKDVKNGNISEHSKTPVYEELSGGVNFDVGTVGNDCRSNLNGSVSESISPLSDNPWMKNSRFIKNSNEYKTPAPHLKPPKSVERSNSNCSSTCSSQDNEKDIDVLIDKSFIDTNGEEVPQGEEFTYGKGFVSKLKQRFQKITVVEKPKSFSPLYSKHAQSCDNISKKAKIKEEHVKENEKSEPKLRSQSSENISGIVKIESNAFSIVPVHNTLTDHVVKTPCDEEENLIPQNVVASTKVLFENISNSTSKVKSNNNAQRKISPPSIKAGHVNLLKTKESSNKVLSTTKANQYTSKESIADIPHPTVNGQNHDLSQYSSLDRSVLRNKQSSFNTDSSHSNSLGSYDRDTANAFISFMNPGTNDNSEKRNLPPDRNSLNLDFSQQKKPIENGIINTCNDNNVVRKVKVAPTAPGKLVIRPASNLMPAATYAESLQLTKFNDITTGEFEPARIRLSNIDGVPVSNIDDVYDDSDDDIPVTNIDNVSLDMMREGESNGITFRSSYNFEGAGVVPTKSSLGKTRKNKALKLQFNDSAIFTHEYPSEQTLLDQMSPEALESPHGINSTVHNSNISDDDDDDDTIHRSQGSKSLLNGPPIGSAGGLGAYKSKLQFDYQIGSVSQSNHSQSTKSSLSKSSLTNSSPVSDSSQVTTETWSNSTSSDLLF